MSTPLTPPPELDDPRFKGWLWRFWALVKEIQDRPQATQTTERLTAAQAFDLTSGGNSSLHYHASDRARSNHTGTQLASTISDFSTAVSAVTVTRISNVLESQVFGS